MGIHWRSTGATISPRAHRTSAKIQILVLGSMLLFSISRSSLGADKGVISVDGSELLGGASKILVDSGQNLVSLAKAGQGLKLQGVPAGGTLAIRYASAEVGTISVAVNDQPARKVNVHSSGCDEFLPECQNRNGDSRGCHGDHQSGRRTTWR